MAPKSTALALRKPVVPTIVSGPQLELGPYADQKTAKRYIQLLQDKQNKEFYSHILDQVSNTAQSFFGMLSGPLSELSKEKFAQIFLAVIILDTLRRTRVLSQGVAYTLEGYLGFLLGEQGVKEILKFWD